MTSGGVSRVTSISYDEFVEHFVDEGLDVSLGAVLSRLESWGVQVKGELRAYYPIDSYVIYDGISERAGRILAQLVEDPRLELVAFMPGRGDQVIPTGALELTPPRRDAGADFVFSGTTPRVQARDRQVLTRLRPVKPGRWVREDQAEPGTLYVFAEQTLSEEMHSSPDRSAGTR